MKTLNFSKHKKYINKRRKFILERCSEHGWADNHEKPISAKTFDSAIKVMKDFMNFVWTRYKIKISIPHIMPDREGGIGLEWDDENEGFTIFHTYVTDDDQGGHADNETRDWKAEGIKLSIHKDKKTLQVLRAYDEWGGDKTRSKVRDKTLLERSSKEQKSSRLLERKCPDCRSLLQHNQLICEKCGFELKIKSD